MIFKLYDCDVGIKVDGQSYDFEHVNSVVIEDPEFNRLTRGSNATDSIGLTYKEGVKEPKTMTMTIMNMSIDLKALFDRVFKDQVRVDAFAISRVDGSSKMAKEAVLAQVAQQLTLDDTPDSMNVTLMFQSFNMSEVHKS